MPTQDHMFITIKCNDIFSVDFCFVLVNIMFEQRFFFAILCNIFFLWWLDSSAWVSALCFPLSLQCLFALIWCDVHSAVFFSSNIDNYDICIIFFRFHSVFSLCHFNVLTYVCIAYNLYECKRKKSYTVFLFKRILFIFFPFQSHMEKTSDNEITTRTYFRLKLVFQLILFIIWF